MGRFASTVPFYERSRPPYGSAFFGAIADRLQLTPVDRLLDLGTGPGLLAIGLAPFVGAAVGVDPEPAMLAAAATAAEQAGVSLRLIEGTAETVPEGIGPFTLVTIGRALHWMEPEPTIRRLDALVPAGGHVLVCRAASAGEAHNPWLPTFDALKARFSADRPKRLAFDAQEAFFAGSRFEPTEPIAVQFRHEIPVSHLADRLFSMSSTSPALLGNRVDAIRSAIVSDLSPFARKGIIAETVKSRAAVFVRRR